MSGLKKTDSLDWLLMEWKSGSRNVVHAKSLVSLLDEDRRKDGEQKTATLIAHARDRNTLDAMVKKSVKEEPGPNCKSESSSGGTYEDAEDYFCSGSSWAPSDDEECSADSDMEDIPVKPKMREKTSKSPTAIRNYSKMRHTSLTKIMSIGNLLPDTENGEEIQNEEDLVDKMDEVKEAFTSVFNLISNLKRQCVQNATEDVEMLLKGAADNVLTTNKCNFAERNERVDDEWVPIGSGKTMIHKDQFRKVNWRSYTFATRTLLVAAFSRRILATHSLTGKKSPAFQEKAAKMCLDPKIISDIIIEVTDRFNVKENVVSNLAYFRLGRSIIGLPDIGHCATGTWCFGKTFIMRTAKEWNCLPESVFPDGNNPGIFKSRVNKFLLEDRATLDAMVKESVKEEAGPSCKTEAGASRTYEEAEDYHSSESSWAPSNDEDDSADSDTGDTTKKRKMIKYKIPTVNNRKYSKRRPTSLTKLKSIGNLMSDSTKWQNGEELQNEEQVLDKMAEVKEAVTKIFTLIDNLKWQFKEKQNSKTVIEYICEAPEQLSEAPEQLSEAPEQMSEAPEQMSEAPEQLSEAPEQMSEAPEQMSEAPEQLSEAPEQMSEASEQLSEAPEQLSKAPEQMSENEQSVHEDEEDNSDELNRSTDNVLITNKYNFVERNEPVEDEWVPIGSGKTMIHKDKFRKVNWRSSNLATRTLLVAAFPRRILATHSLTGKKSPAFQEKAAKMCLDPKIISDIIIEVTDRFNVRENQVRKIITNKCADECKMAKTRKNKNRSENDENVPPAADNNSDEENEI